MKKRPNFILLLIITTILIPIIIYVVSLFVDASTFQNLADNAIKKIGLSEKSVIYNSVKQEVDRRDYYSIEATGDYTWGSFEKVYKNWAEPYTVTEEQYGKDSSLVGYCCYLGWPTIKSANSSYLEDLDTMGGDHDFPSWCVGKHRMALANNDGHRQRIECDNENTFTNLAKTIAYAKSGLNGKYTNGDIQNLVWNSHIWTSYGADAVLQGTFASGTKIDTVGGVVYHYQGDSVSERLVRAQQFATWAYQVLGNDHTLNIKLSPGKESEDEKDSDKKLHVEVDQSNLSYLVGPYKLDLTLTEGGNVINDQTTAAGTGNQSLGDFVYKEIIGQNVTQTASNTFIKTRFIVHAEYTDGEKEDVEVARSDGMISKQTNASRRIVLTDDKGVALPYGMPQFGEDFYIKYYLTTDLAQNHNLKYLQPEIKASYLDDLMSAGGIRAKSKKVSYSVHYSLCNKQDDAVNHYVFDKGYDNLNLAEGEDHGQLYQAFFYSSDKTKEANLQDGIEALKEMIQYSNHGVSGATVTWYDDTPGGWDAFEQYYGDEYDRCDGVFLDECDTLLGIGAEVYNHYNYFYECEYDTVAEFYESCINNYLMTVFVGSPEGADEYARTGATITEYTHNQLTYSDQAYSEMKTDLYNEDNFTTSECGCSEENSSCDCCDCEDEDGDPDCDCDDCDQEGGPCCDCGYYYNKTEVMVYDCIFYRDNRTTQSEIVKRIDLEGSKWEKKTISKSSKAYDTKAKAIEALNKEVNDYIESYYKEAVKKFKEWYDVHAFPALYVPWATESKAYALPFVEEPQTEMQKVVYDVHLINSSGWRDKDYKLTKKEINEYLGGNASENVQGIESVKNAQVDDIWQGSGIEVRLIDLGIMGNSEEPIQPIPPNPVYKPDEIPKPEEPKKPEPPPPPPKKPYEIPKECEKQEPHDCALNSIVNALRSAGYPDLTVKEAKAWFKKAENMNDGKYNGFYPVPSRAACIKFAQDYISKHPSDTATTQKVSAFYDAEAANHNKVSAKWITSHLPEEGNVVPGKTYAAVQVHYAKTPGINRQYSNGTYHESHYVTFNQYRYKDGKLQVYVLNSGTGKGQDSGWMNFDRLISGQEAIDKYNPNNVWDWGAIILEYTAKSSSTDTFSGTTEEYNKLLAQYEKDKAKYDKALKQYEADYKKYQKDLKKYNDNQDKQKQYQKDKAKYDAEYSTYLSELAKYNQAHDAWAAALNQPTMEKVVQITVTDKNGNYGFQRLNPLHKYKLQFRYDGMEYIADMTDPTSKSEITEISDNIQDRITAYETDRDKVNERFANINASNMNYTGKKGDNKAYGWFTKLRADDASFIKLKNEDIRLEPNGGDDNNVGALRFVDAYDIFKQDAIKQREKKKLKDIDQSSIQKIVDTYDDIEKAPDITYEDIIYNVFKPDLTNYGVGTNVKEGNNEYDNSLNNYDETEQVANFIYDSLVIAETYHNYPNENAVRFFLEDVGTGNTNDSNNKKIKNTDNHNNYNNLVADNPFNSKSTRRVNSLYNNANTSNAGTINNRDQARNVDFTFKRRDEANLVIGMDVEQVALVINGQQELYKYGDLELDEDSVSNLAKISVRAGKELLNYQKSYSRVITESMYLYDGKLVDEENGDVRDLSMYITYKIVIKNTGKVNLDVGYIVDHYDSYYLQWKQEDQGKIMSIVGEENCTANVTLPPTHPYDADKQELGPNGINNMYKELFINVGKLSSGEAKTFMITFEQTKDEHGRLNINQDLENGYILVGNKNVVEIDGYSSYSNNIFQKGLITRLSNIGNLCPIDFYPNGKKTGGLIQDNATPTVNRAEVDTAIAPNVVIYIPSKGYIPCISGYTFEDVRSEESDKALIGNGNYNEDDSDKKETSDKDKKINGVTVELVELVREVDYNGMIKEGSASILKEKIWGTTTFKLEDKDVDARRATGEALHIPSEQPNDKSVYRHFSGEDKAQIILDVEKGYLKVSNKVDEEDKNYVDLGGGKGAYKFVNVPPGLFVVRFIYGDTTQTLLVDGPTTNEVNKLIKGKATESEKGVINYEDPEHDEYMFLKGTGFVSTEGLNSKSYNGNDYKSTVYQAGLTQDTAYAGIYGYKDYEKQDFTNTDGISMTQIKDNDLLERLYYYKTEVGDTTETVSDAKDIYAFRQNSDNYAKGYISSLSGNLKQDHYEAFDEAYNTEVKMSYGEDEYGEVDKVDNYDLVYNHQEFMGENPITLRNYRNEIMNAFEKVGTYTGSSVKPKTVEDNKDKLDADRQVEMIKELMKYTRVVAQTGVINFEVEYTVNDWAAINGPDKEKGYIKLDDILNGNPDALNLPLEDYSKTAQRNKKYHIRNLNLGLVERPEAQIRLNKNASNIKITLSNGESIFDTNKSVNNLYYATHKIHTYKFVNQYRLKSTTVTTNSLTTPELIQAYMDDELIENSTLQINYVYTIENIGEVDYLDKQFYYTGKTNDTSLNNISRTNIDEVLDYVPNKINFDAAVSNNLDELRVKNIAKTELNEDSKKSKWEVKSIIPDGSNADKIADIKDYYSGYIYPFGVSENDAKREQTPIDGSTPAVLSDAYLHGFAGDAQTGPAGGNLNADLVNREYFDRVYSYSTILTTDRLSTKKYHNSNYYSQDDKGAYTFGLVPKSIETKNEEDYKIETPLVLSVVMSPNEDLVFPNLVEAVRISNSVGRRCTYSIVGNQPMSNQNYGSDISSKEPSNPADKALLSKYSTYSPVDVVTPLEVDADSSQSVRILPPTGFNKNNFNLYFALIGSLSIIIVSIFMIKAGLGQKKKKRKANIKRWM